MSDLIIIALPVLILRDVQIKWSRKLTVYMVFIPRIL